MTGLLFMTILTALLVLLFLAVVAEAVWLIQRRLKRIGGNGDSFLAKLRFGLRAIERQTTYLPLEVPAINAALTALAPPSGDARPEGAWR